MTDLETTQPRSLAIRNDQAGFTPEQVDALREMHGWRDVPDAELAVFFHLATRTGLDPFARQLYLIPRRQQGGTKWTVQTGIDGYRLIADRTGRYLGQDPAEWEAEHDEEGRRRDLVCRITVYKLVGDRVASFPAEARWTEYAQTKSDGTPTGMWAGKPRVMLAKCAEALALRKAFPADLSGVYTAEEMPDAEDGVITGTAREAAGAAASPGEASSPAGSSGRETSGRESGSHSVDEELAEAFADELGRSRATPEQRDAYRELAHAEGASAGLTALRVGELIADLDAAPAELSTPERRERLVAYAEQSPDNASAARRRLGEEVAKVRQAELKAAAAGDADADAAEAEADAQTGAAEAAAEELPF